jgi:DNA polymerase-1
MSKKRVLVIDGTNNFYRSYIVDPSLSTNGAPIGGVKGFFKILQKLCRESKPDQVVICWDGAGGSQKRRTISKSYKAGRKPIRLNRTDRILSEGQEMENKIWQQQRLIEYLNETPVIQMMLEGVEADDLISLAVQDPTYKGWHKVIVSSDKDFYQLCDDETVVHRPIQKQIKNKPRIIEEFGIHPKNFALARAIAGDKSDNLPGVGGVGLATIAKRIPFLIEDRDVTINEVVEFCEGVENQLKVHTAISENEELIKKNYSIMQLYSPLISVQDRNKIRYALDNFQFMFNKTEVEKMMILDGFGAGNWSELYSTFRRICVDN